MGIREQIIMNLILERNFCSVSVLLLNKKDDKTEKDTESGDSVWITRKATNPGIARSIPRFSVLSDMTLT